VRGIGIKRIIGRGITETPRRIPGTERRTLAATKTSTQNEPPGSAPTPGVRASRPASISIMTTADRRMRSRLLPNRSTPAMITGRRMRNHRRQIRNTQGTTTTGWHMPNLLLLSPSTLDLILQSLSTLDLRLQCPSTLGRPLLSLSMLDLLLQSLSMLDLLLQTPSMLDLRLQRHSPHTRSPSSGSTPNRTRTSNTRGTR